MDLASGYWQVMPINLWNVPMMFALLMEQVLADVVRSTCMVYLDDIMAFWEWLFKGVLQPESCIHEA